MGVSEERDAYFVASQKYAAALCAEIDQITDDPVAHLRTLFGYHDENDRVYEVNNIKIYSVAFNLDLMILRHIRPHLQDLATRCNVRIAVGQWIDVMVPQTK